MLVTQPKPASLEKYYNSATYISHTDGNSSVVEKIYQRVKRYSLGKKVRLIDTYAGASKSLLDVGAGTADFLIEAARNGWAVSGIEPNANARSKALEKGVSLATELAAVKNKKFEVITLWHVLEHLPNIQEHIKVLRSLLTANGVLIVAVPNYKSFDAQHYKSFWAAYDVPRHLWHFSKKTIKKLFDREKMTVAETKPLIFDSFYVSLLSEKYKTGKQNFVAAFFIGLRSNIAAWKTGEYSSLIYILKKH